MSAAPPHSPVAGRLAGRTVLVTGAARGQGRAHCLRVAAEGAAVVAVDVCAAFPGTPYPGATAADLDETVARLHSMGARVFAARADVRDATAMRSVVDEAVAVLGGLDGVVANAGIVTPRPAEDLDPDTWALLLDVNLTGVWHTVSAALPALLAAGRSSIVLTSSANGGLKAPAHLAHYAAAKHGLVGLARSLANELGPRGVRVNTLHPTAVDTAMIQNEATYRLFAPGLADPGRDDVAPVFAQLHSLPVPWVQPEDVAAAAAWLLSDEAAYVTGVALPVDAGLAAR